MKLILTLFFFLLFKDRGIVELQGWTIAVEEGGDTCAELNGGDFVLDGIGELVNRSLNHAFLLVKEVFVGSSIIKQRS